jgi:hypothetical protein
MAPTERLRKDKHKKTVPELEIQDGQEMVPKQQPARDPEIEALRRQVAALTEAMTRYQLNVHANGSNSGENHYDNPFGRPPRTERVPVREQQHIPAKEEPKWEINFKAELLEFHGSLNPDEFTDWIHTDERVFDYQDEAKLQEQFLPFNSTQSLYKSLHNLRQTGSVEEYAESFYQLIARVDLNESEKQLVAQFISGLKIHIQDVLCLHTCWTVSEAFNRALLIEKQKSRRVSHIHLLQEMVEQLLISLNHGANQPRRWKWGPIWPAQAMQPAMHLKQQPRIKQVWFLNVLNVEKLDIKQQIARNLCCPKVKLL